MRSVAGPMLLLAPYPAREYEKTFDIRFKEKQ